MQRDIKSRLREKKIMKMLPKGTVLMSLVLPLFGAIATQAVENSDYTAVPAFISTEVKPNILFILDNSNSMDEDVDGAAVGGASPLSKSEIARNAIKQIIDDQKDNMRFGLMAYKQQNVQKYYIHNSFYYCSYDPATYDPGGTPTPKDPTTNTKRAPNPAEPGHYIYYDTALPMYESYDADTGFCYSKDFTYPENGANHNYWCYHNKAAVFTGTPPVETGTPMGLNKADLPSWGYDDNFMNGSFQPTDSDFAAGFSKFGYEMSWVPKGLTWYVNSSPGGGILHTNIADSDAAHLTALSDKLDTSQFATATDTPLRNAGLTPLAGTLNSAKQYFMGNNTVDTIGGITATNPITLQCQKNYVILLTDGLPSVSASGGAGDADTLLDEVKNSITALRTTQNVDFPASFDVQTYVIGFAIPATLGSKLDDLAVAGGTDVNGKALLANNATELAQRLKALMLDIEKKAATGTAASVVANSRSGEGVTYQSVFHPEFVDALTPSNTVNWVGSVSSLFIDSFGNLREDTNTNKKYDIDSDYLVLYWHNGSTVMARRYLDKNQNSMLDLNEDLNGNGVLDLAINEDVNGNGVLDAGEDLNGNDLLDSVVSEDRNHNGLLDREEDANNNGQLDSGEDLNGDGELYTEDTFIDDVALADLNYVWESSSWLNEISDTNIVAQRAYSVNNPQRYIFTFVDKDGDNIVDTGEQLDFVEGEFEALKNHLLLYPLPGDEPSWLGAIRSDGNYDDFMEQGAKRIINYIRGADQGEFTSTTTPNYTLPAMRSRQVDYDNDATVETWRLGDIIHSSPVAVGAPAEALHLLYRDKSYADFAKKYRTRRSVVYVGGNDGMVHAFNAGFYDHKKYQVTTVSITNPEPFIDSNGNDVWDTGESFTDRNYNGVYDDGRGSEEQYPIGSELWAYVPYNLLPHLRFLTEQNYQHMYYNDLTPRVFDAKIFNEETACSGADGALSPGCVHPHGWGTVLVTGMRFGGGVYPKSRTWDFTIDRMGWTFSPAGNVNQYFAGSDVWVVQSNTPGSFSDASFISPDGFLVDSSKAGSIEIRFTGPATFPGSGGATLYWNYSGLPDDWSVTNSVHVSSPQENSYDSYYTYTFRPGWSGIIKRFRIVLDKDFYINDQVAVDYISIDGGEYTSSYSVFDITDPERPPVVLAELNAPGLGFTTVTPAVIPIKEVGNDVVNDWYLVFGSGPNNNLHADKTALEKATSNTKGRVYVASLKDIGTSQLLTMLDGVTGSGELKLGEQIFSEFDEKTMVSDMIVVDMDLDYDADVAYFGTISGNETDGWGGKMRRLVFNSGSQDPTTWDEDSTLFEAPLGQTITAAPTMGVDDHGKFWLYFGTGRYFVRDDASIIDSQSYYGIKEPLDAAGDLTWSTVAADTLLDTTDAKVYDNKDVVGLDPTDPLAAITWQQLLSDIESKNGWTIELETSGERNLSQAALLGGIATFTTYTPSTDPCSTEGTSNGYALYYKTGTAYFESVLGYRYRDRDGDGNFEFGEQEMHKKFTIGKGLTASPAVHTGGDDGSSVIFQTSDGSILSIEEDNPGMTKSKKTGWKSLTQ